MKYAKMRNILIMVYDNKFVNKNLLCFSIIKKSSLKLKKKKMYKHMTKNDFLQNPRG